MQTKTIYRQLQSLLPISLGTAIFAFGLHYFIIPNQLMEGGLTGIALLLKYVLNLPPSLTTLLLNIPLFYIGWRAFGGKAMFYTIYGTISLAFFLWIMELLIKSGWIHPFHTGTDFILAALYAGVTIGVGLGLVFRFGGTTGGVDIIARIANKKRGLPVGRVIFAMDVIVIGSSLLYIQLEKVLYTLVMVFIASRMIDYITEGAYAARAFTIITKYPEKLANRITTELERGVTFLHATGAFSQEEKRVVYCVVYRNETRRIKEIVKQVDPTAFVIVGEVHDVLGEGFKSE